MWYYDAEVNVRWCWGVVIADVFHLFVSLNILVGMACKLHLGSEKYIQASDGETQKLKTHNTNSYEGSYFFPWRCIQRTVEVCPYSVCKQWPDSAFHTLSVRSVLPLIIMLPDICDDQTPPVWPTSVRRHWKDKYRCEAILVRRTKDQINLTVFVNVYNKCQVSLHP